MFRFVLFFVLVFQGYLLANTPISIVDPLVSYENYFKDAFEKSKYNNFGEGRVIVVLDTGINDDNYELKGKVIKQYIFNII